MEPHATATDLRPSTGFGDEVRKLAHLGAPIALAQLGMMAMGFVDVVFLGHYDAAALSAMSLGNVLCWGAMVFCIGVLAAVDPLIAQAVGARDGPAVTRALLRGLALGAVLTVPAAALLLPAHVWLTWLGQPPDLIGDAALYARLNTLGILPMLWFGLLRGVLSAHSRIAAQVIAIALANALNVLLDWLLIGGQWGLPELGVTGAAWATVVCRWCMLLTLVALGRGILLPHLRALRDPAVRAAAVALRPLLRLLRLGAPIGGQFAMEMGVFAATALLIGQLDARAGDSEGLRLCGHQLAIQLASLSFMVPLGLGMAATVRVGWAIGAGDPVAARRAAGATLLCAVAVMSCFMLLFLLAPGWLAGGLTDDPRVVAWAVLLIPIAGVFQLADGVQVAAIGCLRGTGDVHSPFWINLVGFWAVGLPFGSWLAFDWGRDLGPMGLWWGLTAGLFAVALALLLAMRLRFAEVGPRLRVD
ncbi:MAG: MATE family efflux transporter [Planctomycetota bacterium]